MKPNINILLLRAMLIERVPLRRTRAPKPPRLCTSVFYVVVQVLLCARYDCDCVNVLAFVTVHMCVHVKE